MAPSTDSESMSRYLNDLSKKQKKIQQDKGGLYVKHNKERYWIDREYQNDLYENCTMQDNLKKKLVLHVPVTIIHGEDDEIVPVEVTYKLIQKIKSPMLRAVVLQNEDHFFSNSGTNKILFEEFKVQEVLCRRGWLYHK